VFTKKIVLLYFFVGPLFFFFCFWGGGGRSRGGGGGGGGTGSLELRGRLNVGLAVTSYPDLGSLDVHVLENVILRIGN